MSSIRKRIQILFIVFIITLMTMRLYLYIDPQWDPFKDLAWDIDCCVNNNNIKDFNSQNNTLITYPKDPKDLSFTIVTGASGNHFCPLKSMIYSNYETIKGFSNARVIIYDLGLTSKQRIELNQLKEKGYFTELKSLDWSAYPPFWNLKISKGQYAWKPGIVHEISKEYPGVIVWLDAGSKARRYFFDNLGTFLRDYNGFVSPRSAGNMRTWTHPKVYDYFNDDHKKYDRLPNCNGASVVFDTRITQNLIDAWYNCALDKDCIAPPGSSRSNHRQDQALLTYLAAKEGRFCGTTRDHFGIKIHDDRYCGKEVYAYEHGKTISFK